LHTKKKTRNKKTTFYIFPFHIKNLHSQQLRIPSKNLCSSAPSARNKTLRETKLLDKKTQQEKNPSETTFSEKKTTLSTTPNRVKKPLFLCALCEKKNSARNKTP